MAKTVTSKPILNTDVESTAPDTARKSTKSVTISKSRKRTSLEEFSVVNNLRPEVKAGFKAWLKGEYFHFDPEWEELFEEYKNRQL